jgi:hypothetical protein
VYPRKLAVVACVSSGLACGQGCREVLAGVELQKPKGDSDGTYQGIRLFTCAPNCGVFVKATAVREGSLVSCSLLGHTNFPVGVGHCPLASCRFQLRFL